MNVTLTSDRMPAANAGASRLIWLTAPPSAGPMMKPSPKAIPINAKFLGRSSGVETSAM